MSDAMRFVAMLALSLLGVSAAFSAGGPLWATYFAGYCAFWISFRFGLRTWFAPGVRAGVDRRGIMDNSGRGEYHQARACRPGSDRTAGDKEFGRYPEISDRKGWIDQTSQEIRIRAHRVRFGKEVA